MLLRSRYSPCGPSGHDDCDLASLGERRIGFLGSSWFYLTIGLEPEVKCVRREPFNSWLVEDPGVVQQEDEVDLAYQAVGGGPDCDPVRVIRSVGVAVGAL